MSPQTIMLDKPVIDLPKTWKKTKVFVDFPDNKTMIVKRVDSNQRAINYVIDEKNWSEIKDEARSTRDEVFKQFYPELYGKK